MNDKVFTDEGIELKSTYTLSSQEQLASKVPEFNRIAYSLTAWKDEDGAILEPGASFQITKDKDLSAQWSPITYPITYVLNGGSQPPEGNPETYTIEDTPITFNNPVKTGYTGSFIPSELPSGSYGDKEITAGYVIINYSITYDLKGGTHTGNPDTYTVETETITFNNPVKTGYTGVFSPASIEKGSTGDKLVEAQYTPIIYNVTYELDGGENDPDNPATYTIESETIQLKPAVKEDFNFVKWIDTAGNEVTTIEKGSTGDITLSAVYAKKTVKATYHTNY